MIYGLILLVIAIAALHWIITHVEVHKIEFPTIDEAENADDEQLKFWVDHLPIASDMEQMQAIDIIVRRFIEANVSENIEADEIDTKDLSEKMGNATGKSYAVIPKDSTIEFFELDDKEPDYNYDYEETLIPEQHGIDS